MAATGYCLAVENYITGHPSHLAACLITAVILPRNKRTYAELATARLTLRSTVQYNDATPLQPFPLTAPRRGYFCNGPCNLTSLCRNIFIGNAGFISCVCHVHSLIVADQRSWRSLRD